MKIAVVRMNILQSVSILNKRNVDVLIHCGDYVAPFVKRWFNNLNDSIKKNFYDLLSVSLARMISLKLLSIILIIIIRNLFRTNIVRNL